MQYVENGLTSVDENETKSYYRLHTFRRARTAKGFSSYWKRESVSSASLLFGADEKLQIQDLRDVFFEWEYRDKRFSAREVDGVYNSVRQNIPKEVYRRIQWGDWRKGANYKNGRVLLTTVLHPDAFKMIGPQTVDGLKEKFAKYIQSIPAPLRRHWPHRSLAVK